LNYLKLIAIYAAVVLVLHVIPTSLAPGSGFAPSRVYFLNLRADHLLHMLLFVPWMVLVRLHLYSERVAGAARNKAALLWLALGLALAAGAEGLQYWVPYRSFNPLDLAGNLTGVLLGALAFAWPGRKRRAGRT